MKSQQNRAELVTRPWNKDLMERRHRNEANLLSMSEEVKRCQAEIQKLNRQISSMKAETDRAGEGAKELDQTVHRLQSQISSLEQVHEIHCSVSSWTQPKNILFWDNCLSKIWIPWYLDDHKMILALKKWPKFIAFCRRPLRYQCIADCKTALL